MDGGWVGSSGSRQLGPPVLGAEDGHPGALIAAAMTGYGVGAVNAMILGTTTRPERLDAFATDAVVHDGAMCVGLLVGGALIGFCGTSTVLVAAGVLQVGVAVATCVRHPSGPPADRTPLSSSARSAAAR